MPYFLAIDGGGTKTRCVIADATTVLGSATAGSVKLMRVGEAEATARLGAMLDEVAATAGIPLRDVTRSCFGLAGLSIPAVRIWADAAISAKVAGEVVLCGDEEIALDAAFAGGPGILVIAGTGSNVIGRTAEGKMVGAGGWGPVLGDEGSGYWIGLEAVRAALRAQDHARMRLEVGDASAKLLAAIQGAWGLRSLAELIEAGNHRGDAEKAAPDFASLAPIVAGLAEEGNALATSILNRAGEDLAAQVALVARKMGAAAEPVTVAYTGSVLSQIAAVQVAMISSLALTVPAAKVGPEAVDPLDGALWRARRD